MGTAAARMPLKLPTYTNASTSYRPINTHEKITPTKSSRHTLRIAVIVFLAAFSIVSVRWVKSHPTLLEDIRIAKRLSINAQIILRPSVIPFESATSQEEPVSQVDVSILGAVTTPNQWTAATIPTYPRAIIPASNAPRTDEILFAMATSADRAISQAQWWLWPSFLANPSSPCFVLLPPEDANRVEEVVAKFKEKGLDCIAKASKIKRYQTRVLTLPGEAMDSWSHRSNNIRWLIMGDDDTLWLDKNGLLRMLGQHNERGMTFIASTSERIESLNNFGTMTFGGGGLVMNRALVDKYIEVLPECEQRWSSTFGGDEAVNNCAALAQGVDRREQAYIRESGLHQLDVYGHASGFFEAGLPMMTIHHFFSWAKMMPEWMHQNDDYKVLHVLIQAVKFLGQDNMFKRYSFDNGRTILVNGYSITNYLEPLTSEELRRMEWTWSHAPDAKLLNENVRPPITPIGHKQVEVEQPGRQKKSPYFLQEIRDVDNVAGFATFVYRNERGKEITVKWVEDRLAV